jgi:hypothetical protein
VFSWLCVGWSVNGGLRDHPVSVVVIVWLNEVRGVNGERRGFICLLGGHTGDPRDAGRHGGHSGGTGRGTKRTARPEGPNSGIALCAVWLVVYCSVMFMGHVNVNINR